MRTHAEPIRNRFELLLLLVDAVPRAPPPCLVHKRPVRGIHETDNSVIDSAWQTGGEVRRLVRIRKGWQLRGCEQRFVAARESRARRTRIRNEHPDKAIALFA